MGVAAAALKTYYVALVGCGGAGRPCEGAVRGEPSPANGTVTTTGSFTAKPGYRILQGVSVWDQSSGQGNATLNVILQVRTSTTSRLAPLIAVVCALLEDSSQGHYILLHY